MSIWISEWVPMLAVIVLLMAPGLVLALAAGQRAMSVLTLAPSLSVAIISVAGIVAPAIGLRWGVIPVAIVAALSSGTTLGIRYYVCRKLNQPLTSSVTGFKFSKVALISLVFGSMVIGYRLARIFVDPNFVSQTADNIFHLNAVQFIVENGNASSLTAAAAGGNPSSFYPAAWHGIVALIVQCTGASIPIAASVVNLFVGAMVWPLSMWFLCNTIFGKSKISNFSFAILISCFSAFPYLLIDWGVLYPNFLGLAALPAVVGILLLLSKLSAASPPHIVILSWLALISLAGITLSHPNSIISLLVIVTPLLIIKIARRIKVDLRTSIIRKPLPLVGIFLFIAFFMIIWVYLRPFPISSFNTWPPYQSTAQALGEVLLASHSARGAAWGVGVLLCTGILVASKSVEHRWMVLSFSLWSFLFIVVTAWPPSPVRTLISGGWYDDYKRIAAGMVVVSLPLAILGLDFLVQRSRSTFRTCFPRTSPLASVVPGIVIGIAVFSSSHVGPIRQASLAANENYSLAAGSPIMSEDERMLYSEIPRLVDDNKLIAGNPWDGSAWAFMVSGHDVLFPHVLTTMTDDKLTIAKSLRLAKFDPEVCEAVNRLNVGYVLNSSELIYLPGNPNNENYPGISDVSGVPGFQLVGSVGLNSLYKITAC